MQIDGWTLLLQALNLAILVALLRWLFYRPLMRVIDERRRAASQAAAGAHDAAQAAQARADALAAERAAFEASRESLLQAGRAGIEQERQAAKAQAERDASAVLADAHRRADESRRAARTAMFDDAAGLACELARRLLRATPAGGDAGFVEALLERLRAQPAEERCDWFAAGAPRTVTLASAGELGDAQRSRATSELQALLGGDVGVGFVTDPALLAGAELRFAHGVLAYHWAGEIDAARAALARPPAP